MNKVSTDIPSLFEGIQDGMTLAVGGFGLCGIPQTSIEMLRKRGATNLTCVSNNAGVDDFGLGKLLHPPRLIKKMISSYVGENELFAKLYLAGELEVEFTPQGTLAERMRAGGSGIAAFFTPTGVGTVVAQGKEVRQFDGRDFVMERGIRADYALVKAWRADAYGNLMYRKTARNFNPMAAMCGKVTIAEVEEIVPVGSMDPDQIHTPGVFVQHVFVTQHPEKRIENRTTNGENK